uniref:Guanine nucleotide-binding protein n=1 Tax=Clandestinovirus TaxID=2831644 RepID=A0A8F8KPM7_9VIRU|nr:guanine nucleotide-binding protein [Clandestinovirus]
MSGTTKFEEGMQCKETRKRFKKYLQASFCAELLDFWTALCKYNKKMKKSSPSYDKMYSMAFEIYNKYLTPHTRRKSQPRKTKDNKRFANISEDCIRAITKQLHDPEFVILDNLYNSACSEVTSQLQTKWTAYISTNTNKNTHSIYSLV